MATLPPAPTYPVFITHLSAASSVSRPFASRTKSRQRKLSPQAGRAIERLGHAIEYLSDEFALECLSGQMNFGPASDPRLASIELLKALNREIYLSCPIIPTMRERLSSILGSK